MRVAEATITAAARDLEEPLVRYATRILGDRERARDVVQDAFLKLHQESQAGNDVIERPRRWLYTVCRNRALDILRQQKRLCALDDSKDLYQAVEAQSFDRRAAGEVVELFERLPDKQRRVLEMRFGEDKSYRTIGEATGISTGHVGYLIHDGIRALRRHLGVASLLLLLGAGTFVFLTKSQAPPPENSPDDVAEHEGNAAPEAAVLAVPASSAAPVTTIAQPVAKPQMPAKPRMAPPSPMASAPDADPSASASATPSAMPSEMPSAVPPIPPASGKRRDKQRSPDRLAE
jgi:RNA polymerase sigma-70 factor (ECF subfamily)